MSSRFALSFLSDFLLFSSCYLIYISERLLGLSALLSCSVGDTERPVFFIFYQVSEAAFRYNLSFGIFFEKEKTFFGVIIQFVYIFRSHQRPVVQLGILSGHKMLPFEIDHRCVHSDWIKSYRKKHTSTRNSSNIFPKRSQVSIFYTHFSIIVPLF